MIKVLSLRNMSCFYKKYKNYYKQILIIGLPILLGQLGVIVTGFVDTMMVGRYSTESLASASFVNNMFNLMNIVCLGFSYGLTPIVGAYFAKGRKNRIGEVVKTALILNLLFGVMCGVIMLLLYFFIDEMGQPAELLPLMRPYYLVILLSMIPIVLVNALKQFTDGITDTKLGMVILLGGNVLNIIGNWVLIYGKFGFPEWGLFGAGISTLVARIFMLVLYISCLLVMPCYRKYVRGFIDGIVDIKDFVSIGKLSLPVSMQMGMETAIFTVAAVFVGWLGADSLAAYQVIIAMGTLGFMVYYSFGASMSIMIANYSGVGENMRVKRCAQAGYHIILVSAVLASAILLLCGRSAISLFTSDENVITIALTIIVPWMIYQFGDATQVAFANALRGIKCVMPVMKYAFLAYVVIGIPACYLFAFPLKGGIVGVFLSFAVSLFVAGMLFMRRFYKALKKGS